MERLNEEIKHRTQVVGIFPNTEACLRLVTALCVEQSEEWLSGRRYLEMSEIAPLALHAAGNDRYCGEGDNAGELHGCLHPNGVPMMESRTGIAL